MSTLALSPIDASSDPPVRQRGRAFDEVRSEAAERGALALPDAVLPFSRLRATPEGNIAVPGGELALTEWSRKQLARIFGIRWSHWFDEARVSPLERADELNLRFRRTAGEMKVRSRRLAPGEPTTSNGVLTAFVGSTYAPIDDARVFDLMAGALGSRTDDFRFLRVTLTDATSQYVAVAASETDLGVRSFDPHLSGFLVANSEVGARALTAVVYLVRLICTNGLVSHDASSFRRIHRAANDNALEAALSTFLSGLPSGWTTVAARLRAARRIALPEPRRVIEDAFGEVSSLRRHSTAVVDAYDAEPDATLWGIVQATTRAAQSLLPEDRLEMERFAGRLLVERAPRP
jgi:hypothetical protein